MCVCNKSLSLTRTRKRTKYCDSLLHWCARYILKERIFKKEEEEEDGSKCEEIEFFVRFLKHYFWFRVL